MSKHPVLERLQKQASELDAKNNKSTHDRLTLENLNKKIEAVQRTLKGSA
jgi:hypothetical protein